MKDVYLSNNFKLSEAIRSTKAASLGISNDPDDTDLATIHRTAMKMELVREIFGGKPIKVTSWYRNEQVNKAVGGVPTSQHRTGEAVDFQIPGITPKQIVDTIKQNSHWLNYDQLILEPGWVHISFLTANSSARKVPRVQYLDLSNSK